ncbi:hypothetical protein AAZX31_19G237400 [Glycine max]
MLQIAFALNSLVWFFFSHHQLYYAILSRIVPLQPLDQIQPPTQELKWWWVFPKN